MGLCGRACAMVQAGDANDGWAQWARDAGAPRKENKMVRQMRMWALIGILLAMPVLGGADVSCKQLLWYFDPCASIFDCPPELDPFNLFFNPSLFGEIGPDYGMDPFCTQPGACGIPVFDRDGGISGGTTGAGTTGTTGAGTTGTGGTGTGGTGTGGTGTNPNVVSDRNLKTNFAPVDPQKALDLLARIPIETWTYKADPSSIRHMGPMAQDFHLAYRLGKDNKHINLMDANGVAMAAIQQLNRLVKQKDGRIAELQKDVTAMQTRLATLEASLAK